MLQKQVNVLHLYSRFPHRYSNFPKLNQQAYRVAYQYHSRCVVVQQVQQNYAVKNGVCNYRLCREPLEGLFVSPKRNVILKRQTVKYGVKKRHDPGHC